MTEYETVELCPECNRMQVFSFSGSGRKAFCDGCSNNFRVTVRKIGKSFARIEDSWED